MSGRTGPVSKMTTLHVWPAMVGDSRSRMAVSSGVSSSTGSDGFDLLGQTGRQVTQAGGHSVEHLGGVGAGADAIDCVGDLVKALGEPDPRRTSVRQEEAG